MKISAVPETVRASLWSYDVEKMDLSIPDHRQRVIENILNRGTKDAVDWLLLNFRDEEIADAIKRSRAGSWNKKSLALWSLVFRVRPELTSRFT